MRIDKAVLSVATCLGFAASAPTSAFASAITYSISVNTSSQSGQAGYIDIQFDPGDSSSQFATLNLTDFSTNGVLNPAAPGNLTTGDVSGGLPGLLTLDNGQTVDEYTEGMVFGTTLSATLTFDGPAIESPNGSSASLFSLDFLNSNESAFLFTSDPTGATAFGFNVATISVNPDGSTTPTTYPDVGGLSDATLTQAPSSPEPSTFLLFGSFLAVLGLRVARRRSGAGC
jgi:hypothetical protein